MLAAERLPAWVNDYIGKPFADHGRGPQAFDCWGLVKHVLEEQLGLFGLPDFGDSYVTAVDRVVPSLVASERAAWRQVREPQCGDVVVMCRHGRPSHVGVVVSENVMLHVERGTHACLEELDAPRLKGRIDGYYRHPGR
jgi:cell wall-associated NlpC family hydrolase